MTEYHLSIRGETIEIRLRINGNLINAPAWTGTARDILEAIAFRGPACKAMQNIVSDLRRRKGTPGERKLSIQNVQQMKAALKIIGVEA